MVKLQDILQSIGDYAPSADTEKIRAAFTFVKQKHEGQTRASGEPYVGHVTEVAFLATKLKLDTDSIVTALLHDTVEDTDVTLEDIASEFGQDVARLVDGVTKLSRVNFRSRAEAQAENFRKMLLAMASDIRVLLIKLCDRTHNMRTLEFLSESRRTRIAQETLDIYSPLAHRLGINWMKSELEDLAFRYLKPTVYESIKKKINKKKKEREKYIADVVSFIEKELSKNNIKGEVSGRPKHFYSIYSKMERMGLDFDEIYDLTAFRIVLNTTMECYAALGVIHAAWTPIPGRFKDYVAMPKANSYQSLHTTVVGPQGTRIEIQIRTEEMHVVAETGIAAHWVYKEGKTGPEITEESKKLRWLQDLLDSGKLVDDPHEFISTVKGDLFPQEVFVFSPKGEVFSLKPGATPVDFAFHIHSDVGKHCAGARVNGQQVPLTYELKNGDTVEIITAKDRVPSKDWLDFVVTSKASQRIRAYAKKEERDKSVSVGRELITKDIRKLGKSYSRLKKDGSITRVAEELGYNSEESLLADLGYGKIETKKVLKRLLPDTDDIEEQLLTEQTTLQKIFHSAAKVFRDQSGIKVSGMDDMVFRFAHCCEPLPGDEVVGYVTRGRGVTIHQRSCPRILGVDAQRLLPVSWDGEVKTKRRIKLSVLCKDQIGMLAEMSNSIAGTGANIVTANATATPDGKGLITFEVSVESISQLDDIRKALEALDGVIRVERKKRFRPEGEGASKGA